MHRHSISSRIAARLAPALLLCAFSMACGAQEGGASVSAVLSNDYPEGSIRSEEAADAALRRAAEARDAIGKRFADEERECYSRFFVNACLSDAKEERHLALNRVKRVEIEANEFKRAYRAKEHDRIAAEKAEQERSLQVSEKEGEKARGERIAAHEEKLRRIREKERAEAPERARNAEAYGKKVREAEARQREVQKNKEAAPGGPR